LVSKLITDAPSCAQIVETKEEQNTSIDKKEFAETPSHEIGYDHQDKSMRPVLDNTFKLKDENGATQGDLSLKELKSISVITMLAGSFANFVEALLMHPLDLVKTRFQLATRSSVFGLTLTMSSLNNIASSSSKSKLPRTSILSELSNIMRESSAPASSSFLSPLSSSSTSTSSLDIPRARPLRLWRGSAPAVAMQAPRGALKFGTTNSVEQFLGEAHARRHFIAGATAGVAESVLITPFELVKVRLQAFDKNKVYTNSIHAVRDIMQREGPTGFWRGLESILWRNGGWNAAYFGCIGIIKQHTEVHQRHDDRNTIFYERSRSFLAGAIGGCVGACFSTPIDVAKSRIQNTVIVGGFRKARAIVPWTLPTVAEVARSEGIFGLYRGFVPKLLRLGPGGGVLLLAYDWAVGALSQK